MAAVAALGFLALTHLRRAAPVPPVVAAAAHEAAASMPGSSALPARGVDAGAQARRAELASFLERHPRDGRSWVLLAYAEMEADRFEAAAAAFEKAVTVAPKVAADPGVWCEYADALGMAQGGSLSGRPTELIQRALALRLTHPRALEMAGSAAYERRDFNAAALHWRQLLPQLEAGSKMHGELSAAVARAERLAALEPPAAR